MKRAIFLIFVLFVCMSVGAFEEERTFKVMNAADGLADNSAQIVKCTKTGRIIISTIGNLNFYDGNSFTHVNTRADFQYPLPLYRGNYHLYFDRNHHIWLKNTNYVTCLDLMSESFITNVDSVFEAMGCPETVLDMFVDSHGCAWFLTEKGLHNQYTEKSFSIMRDHALQDMDVSGQQLLMFYDNGEEVAVDTLTGMISHRTKAYEWETAEKYGKSSVLQPFGDGFYQVRNGDKESVLLFFNVKKHEWTTVKEFPYHLNNIKLRDSLLYLPSEYGYWVYDIRKDDFYHQELITLNNGNTLWTDCNTLEFDRQGGMWIGSEVRGVFYGRPMPVPFKAYPWSDPKAMEYARMMDGIQQNIEEFRGKQANCKFIDSRGWTWIGTTTGLCLQRPMSNNVELFTRRNGLNNNVIHSIIEDEDHNIWVATSCGISFLFIDNDKVYFINNFTEDDNVPNETFINCRAIRLPDSTIVMQALDHVVTFRPKNLSLVNSPKPFDLFPKLTRLLVDGDVIQPGVEYDGQQIIDRAVTRVADIYLNSDQTSVSLNFSALNYFRPLQTYYRLRVKGIVNDWIVLSSHNSDLVDEKGMLHLPLIGLKPGDYEVELQVSMFPDVWVHKPYVWRIHVDQPWWQTSGILLAMGFVVLLLVLVNFYYYNRNTRMRDRRQAEEGDIIRKIRLFVERTDAISNEPFAPLKDAEIVSAQSDSQLSQEFIELMVKLVPYVQKHQNHSLTMQKLSQEIGVSVIKLYEVVSSNLYKSPRALSLYMRLQKGADLLTTTDMSVEDIAMACGFYTPNYFIGNFYHSYKQTPNEYRESHKA